MFNASLILASMRFECWLYLTISGRNSVRQHAERRHHERSAYGSRNGCRDDPHNRCGRDIQNSDQIKEAA